ncbi:hypothetical protein [Motiliproteus sediminis]|uniref:hypothetical protein n=1 Tax=Motiliproteus sediminis TaxID=1468178 RepID=UPI001AEFA155|nr:hypothetical protein [Motiliproteus sediminis]
MFEQEKEKIETAVSANKYLGWLWPAITSLLAIALIKHFEYGIHIVIILIIFKLDRVARLQTLHAMQADLQFNILHTKTENNKIR